MIFQNLKEKCEYYRGLTDYKLLPNANVLVMCDGRAFSKLIKNHFRKPFDMDFVNMMNETAKFVCENVQGIKIAFVQSDEISFLMKDEGEATPFFANRMCKILSIIASLATAEFNKQMLLYNIKRNAYGVGTMFDNEDTIYNIKDCVRKIEDTKFAQFDCKCWNVPTDNDAFAWFKYRQLDCIKNSKQQTAQTYLPHKQLVKHNADEQIQMVVEKNGIDWNTFDNKYKYGRFVYKIEKLMNTTLPNGEYVEYVRNKFTPDAAWDLSTEEGRNKFFEIAFKFDE
jgi:tRNA(His) 5'-end guanylyltransferase